MRVRLLDPMTDPIRTRVEVPPHIPKPRCPGSGRRAQKSLYDVHYQWCPHCNRGVWLTEGGYFSAHTQEKS